MKKMIYLAGKIARNDWRHEIVRDLEYAKTGVPIVTSRFVYVGPYFAENAMHGITHGANTHGRLYDDANAEDISDAAVHLDAERIKTAQACLSQIARCDALFAWLGDTTAYGTLVEIGYAAAMNKTVAIASTHYISTPRQGRPGHLDDLWFAVATATIAIEAPTPADALDLLVTHLEPQEDPALAKLESPIERQFWAQHTTLKLPALTGLVPQHPVLGGRYRLDFALPVRKVGIELDGYEYHSSKDAFVKDRARQRDLEAAGWRIIRFAGSEVHRDAARCVRQAAELVSR